MSDSLTEAQARALDLITDIADQAGQALRGIADAARHGTPSAQIIADVSRLQYTFRTNLTSLQALIISMDDSVEPIRHSAGPHMSDTNGSGSAYSEEQKR